MKKKNRKPHHHRHTLPRLEGRNRHHIVPKARGGSDDISNLLLMNEEKHELWHKLFSRLTFEEVAILLLRTVEAKEAQNEN